MTNTSDDAPSAVATPFPPACPIWLRSLEFAPAYGDPVDFNDVIQKSITKYALCRELPICHSYGRSAGCTAEELRATLRTAFSGEEGYLVRQNWNKHNSGRGVNRDFICAWPNALVSVRFTDGDETRIRATTLDGSSRVAVQGVLDAFKSTRTRQGAVFALTSTSHGVDLISLGLAGAELRRQNYAEETIDAYDYVVQDLRADSPAGRLVVLHGPPGTGKTYLIRGLLYDVSPATFIFIPPHVVASINGPDILPALLEQHDTEDGALILIVEDGDSCLVRRDVDNISAISALLNLGDGLLGSLLDVRIVITTNAMTDGAWQIDEAITRKGRLSKVIHVAALDLPHAYSVYRDLATAPKDFAAFSATFIAPPTHSLGFQASVEKAQQRVTLADIYALARQDGWAAPTRATKLDDPGDFPLRIKTTGHSFD